MSKDNLQDELPHMEDIDEDTVTDIDSDAEPEDEKDIRVRRAYQGHSREGICIKEPQDQ